MCVCVCVSNCAESCQQIHLAYFFGPVYDSRHIYFCCFVFAVHFIAHLLFVAILCANSIVHCVRLNWFCIEFYTHCEHTKTQCRLPPYMKWGRTIGNGKLRAQNFYIIADADTHTPFYGSVSLRLRIILMIGIYRMPLSNTQYHHRAQNTEKYKSAENQLNSFGPDVYYIFLLSFSLPLISNQ